MRLPLLIPSVFVLCIVATLSPPALAQRPTQAMDDDYTVDLSQIDPNAILASAGDVLMRAPDVDIDGLFQAAHRASRTPHDAALLCALFDPHADRSFTALANTANRLGPDSRQRFGVALANIAAAGLQSPRQPFDEAAATQTLKSAGVTAMLLHDGFLVGMTTDGNDAASRDARCRSFGWMLDALGDMPPPQRAAATRLMLREGMAQLGGAPRQ